MWISAVNYWKFFLRRQVVLTLIVQPAVFGLLVGRLAVIGNVGPSRTTLLALGAGVFSMWSMTAGSSVIGIFIERESERLPLVVSSPTSLWALTTGVVLGALVASLPALFVSWTAFWAAGAAPHIANFGDLTLGLIALILSLIVTGILLAPLFTITDSSLMYFNGLLYPIVLLSGFISNPLDLPRILQYASYAIAPYWGFRIVGSALDGFQGDYGNEVFGLIVSSSLYVIVFRLLAIWLDHRMRRSGAWLV